MNTADERFDFAEYSAGLVSAMANASRLMILQIIAGEEMCVGDLSDLVGLSQSALSQHLAKLRDAGLVSTRREAQTVYYSCQSSAVLRILAMLDEIFVSEQTRLTVAA